MARKTARRPARPPSSTTQCAPCRAEAAARTEPPARCRATARAQDTHRRTDVGARCECPSAAPAPSTARCHHRTAALARDCRSAGAPVPVLVRDPVHQARRAVPPFAVWPDDQHARCAQGANSDEPSHPCVSWCGADTCARINPTRGFQTLALQLLFCFEVRALGGGLVSSTP